MCIMACGFFIQTRGGPATPPRAGQSPSLAPRPNGPELGCAAPMAWGGTGGKGGEGVFHPLRLSVIAAGSAAARIK